QYELVPTNTSQYVPGTNRKGDCVNESTECLITLAMPLCVIDNLASIKIHINQRQRCLVTVGKIDFNIELSSESSSIPHLGEGINQCGSLQSIHKGSNNFRGDHSFKHNGEHHNVQLFTKSNNHNNAVPKQRYHDDN